MFCARCNNELGACVCPDIRQSLHSIPPRHKPPHPRDYADYFGMPDLAKQRKQAKRARIGTWLVRVVVWAILIAGAYLAGYRSL